MQLFEETNYQLNFRMELMHLMKIKFMKKKFRYYENNFYAILI